MKPDLSVPYIHKIVTMTTTSLAKITYYILMSSLNLRALQKFP